MEGDCHTDIEKNRHTTGKLHQNCNHVRMYLQSYEKQLQPIIDTKTIVMFSLDLLVTHIVQVFFVSVSYILTDGHIKRVSFKN